jgi:SAM-dependent methyltransferase
MSTESFQLNTWSHFQNQAPEVFRANHPRLDYMLRLARRLTRAPRPSILNIGVGDGYLERQAKALGWDVHALDPDSQATSQLCQQGIHAVAGSIETMPFAGNLFDVVVTSEILEHLTETQRDKGLFEIARALKPGGHLIGSVPYREDMQMNTDVCPNCRHVFHRWGHTTAFDPDDVKAALSKHFSVQVCRRTTFVKFKGLALRQKVESLARLTAAKFGLGTLSILFVARKPRTPSG